MSKIDDSFAKFFKKSRVVAVVSTPIYWRSQIGLTASLPRAINYYLQWLGGQTSSDKRYDREQLAIVTVYFQQWLAADCWLTADNTALNELRSIAASVKTMEDLKALHKLLVAARIDPIQ
jgi:hypothetical protein